MVAVVTASATRDSTYAGESFALDTVLTWAELLARADRAVAGPAVGTQARAAPAGRRAGAPAAGRGGPGRHRRHRAVLPGVAAPPHPGRRRTGGPGSSATGCTEVRAPVLMVTGWQDIFLPAQLDDHARLRAAGARPAWSSARGRTAAPACSWPPCGRGWTWLDEHLARRAARAPPARRRCGCTSAAPAAAGGTCRTGRRPAVDTGLAPAPGRRARGPPAARVGTPDAFRYDPADPTPSLGGPLLVAQRAGPVDNRPRRGPPRRARPTPARRWPGRSR